MRSSERLGARSSILASRHPSDVPTRFTAVTLQSASRRASNAPFHFVCRFERSPRGRNFPPVREFRHAFPFFFFPPLFFLSTCNCCVGNISLCDQTCVKTRCTFKGTYECRNYQKYILAESFVTISFIRRFLRFLTFLT